jgi:DNA invertase Pin-like site-specific DNA recombinase
MSEPRCFSYVRFSTPEQLNGDSLRRQVQATAEWCRRNNVPLDTSLSLRDLGKSAFRGSHKDDKAALGAFLRAVNQGKVPKGSFLVVENLDRLSREEEVPACHLLTSILMAGVKVVQLFPAEIVLTEQSNGWELMRAVMELSRAHGESAAKSKRNGETWEQKRQAARAGSVQPPRKKDGRLTRSMTSLLPAWIEDVDGVLKLIPEKAAAVHRVYKLAAEGYGACLIGKALAKEGWPVPGECGYWSRAYVSLLLDDRRAVGECQPRYRNGKPAGEPIKDYFPACVSEEEWQRARDVIGSRKKPPRGRVGEYINVFAGLLMNARMGEPYYIGSRTNHGKYRRVLIAKRAVENSSMVYGFDFHVFERAVLGLMKEIDPKEVIGEVPGQDEIIVVSRELERVRTQQEAIAVEMTRGDAKSLAIAARALDAEEKKLTEKLDDLKAKTTYSNGESWGEVLTLIDAVEKAPDPKDARLKLRALLRRLVKEIWILVVPLTATQRVAEVQIFFESGGTRNYLIFCKGAGKGRQGGWRANTLASPGPAGHDLRRKKDVAYQIRLLEKMGPEMLWKLLDLTSSRENSSVQSLQRLVGDEE